MRIIDPELLHIAYMGGAFPMGEDDGSVQFFVPYERAVFDLAGVHVSRSMRRLMNSGRFRITLDKAFSEVIRNCRRPSENWINEPIIDTFCLLNREGRAHSLEVWEGDALAGGIYGLSIGTIFGAESMFHRVTGGSKIALWALVECCRESGFELFDAQMMNPHLEFMGATPMSQEAYLRMLNRLGRLPAPTLRVASTVEAVNARSCKA
jgi:leucyl/phenylalanyl-tRNA--protein transferase